MFTHSTSARLRPVVLAVVAALACQGRAWADTFLPFPNNATHDQATILAAIANVPAGAGVVYDEAGNTDTIQIWNFQDLVNVGPVNVSATLDRIRDNDWMALHRNDGGFFNLLPGELPNVPRMGPNYYMEFVVWPDEFMNLAAGTYDPRAKPYGSIAFPGPMRILLGRAGEVYFTGDHYGEGPAHLPAYYVNPTGPPPSRFQITAAPTAVAGTPFDIIVTALDASGNLDTTYQGTVTFTSSDAYPGLLPANYTFTSADQGRYTLSGGVTLFTAGTQTLTVQDTADSSLTGNATVAVVAAPASRLLITAPAAAVSGMPFDMALAALDPYANVDLNYAGTVTWTSSDSDPGVILPADYTFQPTDNGVVTFPAGVTLITLGNQTLTATDTVSGITGSASVTVGSGP